MPFSTPFTGHNLARKQAYTDFQMPKQYWWSAGVAGFRGTIANWVATLVDWNPGLDEDLASEWFSCAFDYPMPSDYPVSAYETEATDEWFTTSVRDQTRKMMVAAETVDRYVPYVGLEHFGSNWLTPSELGPPCCKRCGTRVRRGTVTLFTTASRPTTGMSSRRHSLGE